MKCVNCGMELAPGTTVCPNCHATQPLPSMDDVLHSDAVNTGAEARMQQTPPPPGNHPNGTPYLIGGIILTVLGVCCCFLFVLPFSITTIVFAAKTNGAVTRGLYEEAARSLHWAKIWLIVSLCVAGVTLLFDLVVGFLGMMADTNTSVTYDYYY